jgi:adenylate kinase
MILVLLGPPGSGKGTQAKKLFAEHNWPQLSTGDMLRNAIAKGTQLGAEAKSFMDKGSLVPDAVVVGLIAESSQSPAAKNGFILDGFPRNVAQAKTLDQMLLSQSKRVDRAVLFQIADNEVVNRIAGRRTCVKCGAMYHIITQRSKKDGICDACGSQLVQREDDKPEVIQKRLAVYHEQTAPLVEYYANQKKLSTVDAQKKPDQVTLAIDEIITEVKAKK